MNGLPIANEQVTFPFFILHCFKKTLYSCCKDTSFIVFSATIYAYLHLLVELTY